MEIGSEEIGPVSLITLPKIVFIEHDPTNSNYNVTDSACQLP